MNRKVVLTGLAALTLAASAVPASAQGLSVGLGFGDGWYGDYGPGVSVGFGSPGWGYNNWGYGAYAAAPCTCGTGYRSVRVAPRYRSSAYAWGGDGYASYPYNDYSYGGGYASVGFGWSDDDWRRRSWRDGRQFSREDRVRISNRETRFNDREIRGGREDFRDRGRMSRASVSGESRTMTRGGGEVRGGARNEIRAGANTESRGGTNPADFSVRSGANTESRAGAGGGGRSGASAGAESRGGMNGGGRRGDNR
jgi:hypothetical protein